MKLPINPTLSLAVLSGISLVTPAFAAVSIDWVAVGNAGNASTSITPGGVAYEYAISRNETTILQYAEFLNAVSKTDTYSLYNTQMATDTKTSGITRSGTSGSFTYSVNAGSENRPIAFVSWFDAARFANWVHNGQPTGAQDATTTEGGAYTVTGLTVNSAAASAVSRNVGATVWLPTNQEWYKAAYYDPTKGTTGGYWAQATQSDTLAGNTIGVADSANYFGSGTFRDATTNVGAYGANSQSYYGTNDQAGNLWEWIETANGANRQMRGSYYGGGNVGNTAISSHSHQQEWNLTGFRLAGGLTNIPEPSSILLTMLASGMMLIRRKR